MTSSKGEPLQRRLSQAFSCLACLAVLASGAGLWAAWHVAGQETGVMTKTALFSAIAVMLVAVAIAVFSKAHFERHLSERLAELSRGIKTLVAGDHHHPVPNADETDEIGNMIRSVSILRGRMADWQEGQAEEGVAKSTFAHTLRQTKPFRLRSTRPIVTSKGSPTESPKKRSSAVVAASASIPGLDFDAGEWKEF